MDSSFLVAKISLKLKRGHPNGGAKCRWSRLNAGAVAANWRLSTVVSLSLNIVVHLICLQHVRRDAARRAGLLADPCNMKQFNIKR